MVVVVVDQLAGDDVVGMGIERLTGVGVDIESGEVRAGDVYADAMPALEHVARRIQQDGELDRLPRFEEAGLIVALPIPRPHDAITEVEGKPVRPIR